MIYLAGPVVGANQEHRKKIIETLKNNTYMQIYDPSQLKIPNAWAMPQQEWARCVFTEDVLRLREADWVVVMDYGRNATAGTAWEAGYAFAAGKRILTIVMPGVEEQSLMIRCGSTYWMSYDTFVLDGFNFSRADGDMTEKYLLLLLSYDNIAGVLLLGDVNKGKLLCNILLAKRRAASVILIASFIKKVYVRYPKSKSDPLSEIEK